LPQVYLNWKRKSTVGWSLENVLLDFAGGSFSLAQQIIDSVARGKPFFGSGSQGFNIVKFLLSVIAIIFDLIFMFQHYVLYRDQWANTK
jgi:cystinosin